jgi:PleD family two-component response regulator
MFSEAFYLTAPQGIVMAPINMKERILVADDDESIRDIFKIILEREGYSLEMKEGGEELLEDKISYPRYFPD